MEKNLHRQLWLDYLRAFACILVTVGHLLMSLESDIFTGDTTFVDFFVQAIYHFHVFIFFFCSGYLFQLGFIKNLNGKEYAKKKLVRCIDFAVPYVVFSFVTFLVKTVLSSSVNTPVEDTFVSALFVNPLNQMWFLYALVIITLLTPVIRSEKVFYIIFGLCIVLKIITFIPGYDAPTPIDYLLQHQIWFVLGMMWAYKNIVIKKWLSLIMAGLFVGLCVVEFVYGIENVILNALLTLMGVLASVGIVRMLTEKKNTISFVWKCLSKYMLQIYLLHTLCAAGIRIVLIKVGVTNEIIHILLGLIFSFIVPIVCAVIAERTKVLNIVFFPSKTIKALKVRKTKE